MKVMLREENFLFDNEKTDSFYEYAGIAIERSQGLLISSGAQHLVQTAVK